MKSASPASTRGGYTRVERDALPNSSLAHAHRKLTTTTIPDVVASTGAMGRIAARAQPNTLRFLSASWMSASPSNGQLAVRLTRSLAVSERSRCGCRGRRSGRRSAASASRRGVFRRGERRRGGV